LHYQEQEELLRTEHSFQYNCRSMHIYMYIKRLSQQSFVLLC